MATAPTKIFRCTSGDMTYYSSRSLILILSLRPSLHQIEARLGGAVGRYLSWLRHGDRGTNPTTAITFSCLAINFPTVLNLQHHQRPVPLISGLYGVGG